MRNNKAQMTLEYILLLTVVLLGLLWGMNNPIKNGLKDFFQGLGDHVGTITESFSDQWTQ